MSYLIRVGCEERFDLDRDKNTFLIGRSALCDITLASQFLSRKHCEIRRVPPNNRFIIKNLTGTNGTYLDNVHLSTSTDEHEIENGALIGLGVPLNHANAEGFAKPEYVFLRLVIPEPRRLTDPDCTLEFIDGGSNGNAVGQSARADISLQQVFRQQKKNSTKDSIPSLRSCAVNRESDTVSGNTVNAHSVPHSSHHIPTNSLSDKQSLHVASTSLPGRSVKIENKHTNDTSKKLIEIKSEVLIANRQTEIKPFNQVNKHLPNVVDKSDPHWGESNKPQNLSSKQVHSLIPNVVDNVRTDNEEISNKRNKIDQDDDEIVLIDLDEDDSIIEKSSIKQEDAVTEKTNKESKDSKSSIKSSFFRDENKTDLRVTHTSSDIAPSDSIDLTQPENTNIKQCNVESMNNKSNRLEPVKQFTYNKDVSLNSLSKRRRSEDIDVDPANKSKKDISKIERTKQSTVQVNCLPSTSGTNLKKTSFMNTNKIASVNSGSDSDDSIINVSRKRPLRTAISSDSDSDDSLLNSSQKRSKIIIDSSESDPDELSFSNCYVKPTQIPRASNKTKCKVNVKKLDKKYLNGLAKGKSIKVDENDRLTVTSPPYSNVDLKCKTPIITDENMEDQWWPEMSSCFNDDFDDQLDDELPDLFVSKSSSKLDSGTSCKNSDVIKDRRKSPDSDNTNIMKKNVKADDVLVENISNLTTNTSKTLISNKPQNHTTNDLHWRESNKLQKHSTNDTHRKESNKLQNRSTNNTKKYIKNVNINNTPTVGQAENTHCEEPSTSKTLISNKSHNPSKNETKKSIKNVNIDNSPIVEQVENHINDDEVEDEIFPNYKAVLLRADQQKFIAEDEIPVNKKLNLEMIEKQMFEKDGILCPIKQEPLEPSIKQEPMNEDDNDPVVGNNEEDDDDEDEVCVVANYSQVDDIIWCDSSDEESEDSHKESESKVPDIHNYEDLPSPDDDLDIFMKELEEEDTKVPEIDVKNIKKEDDAWSLRLSEKIDSQENEKDEIDSKRASSSDDVISLSDDEEEDDWWPELSQSFLDEDSLSNESTAKKVSKEKDSPPPLIKDKSSDAEKYVVKPFHQTDQQKDIGEVSIEPLHEHKKSAAVSEREISETEDNDDDNEQWWPELSQNFFADEATVKEKSFKQNKMDGNHSNWFSKKNEKNKRLTVLIEPKTPPPRTKADTLRVKGIKPLLPVTNSGKKDSFKVPFSPTTASSSKSYNKVDSKKPRKKGPNLRDNLSKKLSSTSSNTLSIEKRKHHLVSIDAQSVTPPKPVSSKTDENISVIKRPKPSGSGDKDHQIKKTPAVKVSSNRKLREFNLFESNPLPQSRSKGNKKSSKMQDLFGDSKDTSNSKSSKDKESRSNENAQNTKKDEQNKERSSIDIESALQNMEVPPSIKSKPTRSAHQPSKKCEKPNDKTQNTEREEMHTEAGPSSEPSVPVAKTKFYSILKKPGRKKVRHNKKIHFPSQIDELEKIQYIEPREKSDKLGPLEARASEIMPMQEIYIDKNYQAYFILHVCKWNYDWLETYRQEHEKIEKSGKNKTVPPPPVTISKEYPTLVLYNSFKDYKEIFSNLMYLEIWESLYKEWMKNRRHNSFSPYQVDKVSESLVTYEGKNLKLYNVVLNTVLTKEQYERSHHAKLGSLVCFKVKQGTKTSHFFGYVDYISKKKRRANKELEDLIPNGEGLLSIVVKITKINENIKSGAILSICDVYYLRPSVRTWEGLVKLPTSPLCHNILKPCEKVFTCDVNPQSYFIHAMPLNDSQKDAVVKVTSKCISNPNVSKLSLIHGPPGTGKTRTIAALIAQISNGGIYKCRILLCAPSNAAVDELTRRLVRLREIGISLLVVRTGLRASTSADIKEHTLDHLVNMAVRKELSTPKNPSLRNELNRHKILVEAATNDFQKAIEDKVSIEERRPLELRLHDLSRKKKDFENSCLERPTPDQRFRLIAKFQEMILTEAQVITATLASCRSGPMEMFIKKQNSFTCCIIDEAGQCCETDTLLPLLLGINKLVLVGDHKQLPATVLSRIAQGKNLHQSLFERLHHRMAIELQKTDKINFLGEQYRMHPEIASWPSRHFYQGHLTTFRGIDKERACQFKPYIVFDLKCSKEEKEGRTGGLHNPTEAMLVRLILDTMEPQIQGFTVGVITPYQCQKQHLEGKLASLTGRIKLDINTIDAFQGQERDIIILSFVRANDSCSIGFLSQRQRLNVALTRARRCCFIVANLASLKGNKDWVSLINDAKHRGKIIPLEKNVPAYSTKDIQAMIQI